MQGFRDRYLYLFVHLKGLLTGRFSRSSYSQWGEDRVITDLFKDQPNGFYVDVGAFHPFHYSNTALLYKKGWQGINIDPNPSAIALFSLHRGRDTNLNLGVAEREQTLPYYVFNHQAYNTFSDQQKTNALKNSFVRLIETKQIRCQPLSAILASYAQGKHIDFLNIDVEGMSMNVLRSFPLDSFQPKVICVEDDEPDTSKSDIFSFLTEAGYTLHVRLGHSTIYTRL